MAETTTMGVRAEDGENVIAHLYANKAPRQLVVIAGAFAVKQSYYARFAHHLADLGLAVVSVDYRGIGRSRPADLRQMKAGAMDWVADLDAAVEGARVHYPDLPLTVVAHSFGGQVLPLTRFAGEVTTTVALGTQFAHPTMWTGRDRLRMELIFRALIPAFTSVYGYLPSWSGIGEDTPAAVSREWARWCRSPGYLLEHVPEAVEAYGAFTSPVEAWAIADDDYAPHEGVRRYAQALPHAEVVAVKADDFGLETLGHFGPFRPSAERLWTRVAQRLEAPFMGQTRPAAPPPSATSAPPPPRAGRRCRSAT